MRPNGMTLLELLVSITIASILTLTSAPSLSLLVANTNQKSTIKSTYRMANMARYHAILREEDVVLCSLNSEKKCSKKLIGALAVFIDKNNDKTLNEDEELIYEDKLSYKGQFKMRVSLNRSYFEFSKTGASKQAGSFVYCDPKHANVTGRVTISMSGRSYKGVDTNSDGIVELTNGKPITCS